MVKVTKLVTSRPLLVFIFLAILVLIVGSISITIWYRTTKNIENDVASFTEDLQSGLVSGINNIGTLIYPTTNSSETGLAKFIDSNLINNNTHQPSFTEIQSQIGPVLFQAYSTISHVSQVSFISANGFYFSYIFTDLNRTVAVYANNSVYRYIQNVDEITGHLYGNVSKSQPFDFTHTEWFRAALQGNITASFVSKGLGGEVNESLLQTVVSLYSKKGVVSLGFPVKKLTGYLNRLNLHGGELYLWTKEGTLIYRNGSLDASLFISNGSICFDKESNSCISTDQCNSNWYKTEIGDSKFQVFCSEIEIAGVEMRYTMMLPDNGDSVEVKKNAVMAMVLLVVITVMAMLWGLGFVYFMVQAARREMYMRATLINQMEATQQAERKSMNKSLAFASASHDIRGALAGINGLIDLCREEAKPGSDLDTSLKQVEVCSKDLVTLLNSVLDMSKIESGKMQLEEEEFNLANLLEDVTDYFHPVAMKKGVDVVLDLQDGSLVKFCNVRGDRGKLKQILNNLVSNAVKFTVEGHISIRGYAQRPCSKSSVVVLGSNSRKNDSKLSRFRVWKNKDQSSTHDIETAVNSMRNNVNTMEFVFEVDDTGKGIPLEMRKSVFENYVQVRETVQEQQGTGLGLGIVQSLVRLMGGEIKITDKAMGEKGTCFQFNIFLKTTSESLVNDMKLRQDVEVRGDCVSTPNLGLTINTSFSGSMSLRNLSPRLNSFLSSSPKQEGSRVVLLLKDEERRRVTEKYIKSLGVKVTVVEKWEHLIHVLERLCGFSPQSSSSPSLKEIPLMAMENQVARRRNNSFSATVVLLLVIDAKTGPFSELYEIVEQFRRSLHNGICCKVVWLNESSVCGSERGDISLLKPLHGSHLNKVMKMLPEFGGNLPKETSFELQRESLLRHSFVAERSPKSKRCGITEIQEEGLSSRYSNKTVKSVMNKVMKMLPEESLISDDKFLRGKRVLVVDDNRLTCSVASRKLNKMGVSEIKQCNSGKEAVRLVTEWFKMKDGSMDMLPFDYIFMDCQMPEMDGYEATRQIREAEKQYGVHIPIIAVSGHDPGSVEAREAIEAGMDAFVEKNLKQDQLSHTIREIESKMAPLVAQM